MVHTRRDNTERAVLTGARAPAKRPRRALVPSLGCTHRQRRDGNSAGLGGLRAAIAALGAGALTQSMSGRPASGLMFFFGIETEPPRAGISATIRCGAGAEDDILARRRTTPVLGVGDAEAVFRPEIAYRAKAKTSSHIHKWGKSDIWRMPRCRSCAAHSPRVPPRPCRLSSV